MNARPTLRRTQPLLETAVFQRSEGERAVSARAQLFSADGLLAHQRGGRRGEDVILVLAHIFGRFLHVLNEENKMLVRVVEAGGSYLGRTPPHPQ